MSYKEQPSRQTLEEWHDDPSNWTLGVFYYNKEDKRLFPPKRIGWMGWTVNFANPVSIITLLCLIILVIIGMKIIY
jgi:uncharacterized membrane protein